MSVTLSRGVLHLSEEDARRFWAKADNRGEGECWPWMASKGDAGHGRFRVDGKIRSASHASLVLAGRTRPEGLMACHHCDNPPCVNPAHLYWGTAQDNADDCTSRGRRTACFGDDNGARKMRDRMPTGERHGSKTRPDRVPAGERHYRSKFSDAERAEVAASNDSNASLAARFGVTPGAIANIKSRDVPDVFASRRPILAGATR